MKKYLFFFLVCISNLFPQSIVINEIMSSNSVTIKDEDGDYSDWFELYNKSDAFVDLTGWSVSDDKNDINKWKFPACIIPPKKHLILFASDKNRLSVLSWQPVVKWGDYWKYFQGVSEPSTNWKNINFDDNSWLSGKSGFGYGDNDDSTITSNVNSVYIRKTFDVDDTASIKKAFLHVDYDDGFVAYINGVEVVRANIGTVGIPPSFNQSAATAREALIYQGGKPVAFDLQKYLYLFKKGTNVIAIQIHNYGIGSTDLSLIPFLSLEIAGSISSQNVSPLLNLQNTSLHTNFKISSEGESLFLSDSSGSLIDQVSIPALPIDISYQRKTDGDSSWIYSKKATPGIANDSAGYTGLAGTPAFSFPGGFYSNGIGVTLTPSSPGNKIYYTLDCNEPTKNSLLYNSPILITKTTVIRAKEIGDNLLPGKTITNTYIYNYTTSLPVFSLVTAPANLWDVDYGIYALGDSAQSAYPYFGANYWMDWERPVNISLFDNNGQSFNSDAGIKIFGNYSRAFDQKSVALYARGEYGSSNFNYKFFDKLPFDSYGSFVLRNSGNDWQYTLLRDGLTASILENMNVEHTEYKPTVVFLNGEYWGIHDLREKINEDYLVSHFNAVKDSVTINEITAEMSTWNPDFRSLWNFISTNDMTIDANYNYVKSKMDIDEFISYNTAEIYIDNTDWPGNNLKIWRPDRAGKWRWILYDTDFSYGLFDNNAYLHNTLDFATTTGGPAWPNPDWSTLMLRKLLTNKNFKTDFINQFSDFVNTRFNYTYISNKLNQLKTVIAPEISKHAAKWGQFNLDSWLANVQRINDFAMKRPAYITSFYVKKFSLTSNFQVSVSINDTAMGYVKFNSLIIRDSLWSGRYFGGLTQTFIAVPANGYKFVKWEGTVSSNNDTVKITLGADFKIKAIFEKDIHAGNNIVINELNYNSETSFNSEDWIELYNNSYNDVNLSGWSITDGSGHSFNFTANTTIKSNNFIVVCKDTTLFKNLYPGVLFLSKLLGYGFSGSGEHIQLNDASMQIIDSLTYDDADPWPLEPDGKGTSLSLKNPDLDNSNPLNWMASVGHGTPGAINDIFTAVEKTAEIPSEYQLNQNYPNPFNPSTVIRFSLPKPDKVTIKLYDILGNEIKTLLNMDISAGVHETEVNLSNLSSGVYFYTLTAGNYFSVKKMQLIK